MHATKNVYSLTINSTVKGNYSKEICRISDKCSDKRIVIAGSIDVREIFCQGRQNPILRPNKILDQIFLPRSCVVFEAFSYTFSEN